MPGVPVASEDPIRVRAFEAKDEPRVLELLQAGFGKWPSDLEGVTPSEFFRWKHMAGPFGPSILLVAEADGAVVGFGAYMPWRFRADGRVLQTMRGVDFVVHSSYQRRGASMAVRAAANFPNNVAFTWSNPNEWSRLGGIKFGQRQVGGLAHFIQPRGLLRGTIQGAHAEGTKMTQHARIEAATAAEVFSDDAHAPLLLARTKEPRGRLGTVKDLDYVRWRYGHFDEYHAIQADAGAGGTGVVIFRSRRRGRFRVAEVCELFVEHNDRRAARRLLRQVRDATRADRLSCSFFSRREAALCGFVQSRHGTTVMTYQLQQNVVPDPSRRDSWAPSLGDMELL
jgi:hypothetical protein